METRNELKNRIMEDNNGTFIWADEDGVGGAWYIQADVHGEKLTLLVDGTDELFTIIVLPSDTEGHLDVWLRRVGGSQMVRIYTGRGRTEHDIRPHYTTHLPEYMPLI